MAALPINVRQVPAAGQAAFATFSCQPPIDRQRHQTAAFVTARLTSRQPQAGRLIYREPLLGRDYWILDDVLPRPYEVRERMLRRDNWVKGSPYRPESWPGMRALPALSPDELAPVDEWMLAQTGRRKIYQAAVRDGANLNHNCIQVVAAREGMAKPHTDSRALCTYAGVLYLSPDGPEYAGTTFFRVRLPNGAMGGNTVPSRCTNLAQALGTRFVPPDFFDPDVSVDYRFNRLLVYRADMIHSATAYFGDELSERRMAAVFFWMAK